MAEHHAKRHAQRTPTAMKKPRPKFKATFAFDPDKKKRTMKSSKTSWKKRITGSPQAEEAG